MSYLCKDFCLAYKADRLASGARYAIGQKRCQVCCIFIWWAGIKCPCCGIRLRTSPRMSKHKILERLIAKV